MLFAVVCFEASSSIQVRNNIHLSLKSFGFCRLSTSRNALHEIFERICKLNESSKMKKQDFLNIVVSNFKVKLE